MHVSLDISRVAYLKNHSSAADLSPLTGRYDHPLPRAIIFRYDTSGERVREKEKTSRKIICDENLHNRFSKQQNE